MSDVRQGGGARGGNGRIVEMVTLQIRGSRPDNRRPALVGGRIDRGLHVRGVLGRDDRPPRRAPRHREPDEGRGPLPAPQRLVVLRQPTIDGGRVEGHPQLPILGVPILLNVAARIAEQRREGGVFLGRPASRHPHQHDAQRGLEGGRLGGFGPIGHRNLRLIELRPGQRGARLRRTKAGEAQAQKRQKMQISGPNAGVVSCHGVIA